MVEGNKISRQKYCVLLEECYLSTDILTLLLKECDLKSLTWSVLLSVSLKGCDLKSVT